MRMIDKIISEGTPTSAHQERISILLNKLNEIIDVVNKLENGFAIVCPKCDEGWNGTKVKPDTPKPEGQIPKGHVRETMHGLEEFDGNHWHPYIGKYSPCIHKHPDGSDAFGYRGEEMNSVTGKWSNVYKCDFCGQEKEG